MNKKIKNLLMLFLVTMVALVSINAASAYYYNYRYYPDIGYDSASYDTNFNTGDYYFNKYGLDGYYKSYDPYGDRGSFYGYNTNNFNYNSYVQNSVDIRVDSNGRYRSYPYGSYGYSYVYPYNYYSDNYRYGNSYREPYYAKYRSSYYNDYTYDNYDYYDSRYYYYN